MAFNASELLSDPIAYSLTVFIDLLGTGFYLIPVSVIAGALFLQKRDPAIVSLYMITSGALLGTGSIFAGYGQMAMFYIFFAAVGIGSLFMSLYYKR